MNTVSFVGLQVNSSFPPRFVRYFTVFCVQQRIHAVNCNIVFNFKINLLIECNAFDRRLNNTSISMATKAITIMSATTTAMATVATLEPPPSPPMGCAVLASGLLVVPWFVVEVVESPSVISGPPAVVMSVVTSSGVVVSSVGSDVVVEDVVTSIVVASIVVASMVVTSMIVVVSSVGSDVVAPIVVTSIVVVVFTIVGASVVATSMTNGLCAYTFNVITVIEINVQLTYVCPEVKGP